ncbi:hypothetical protein ACP70R_030598 [Stipagrostis hirtigluma subsp. patula]
MAARSQRYTQMLSSHPYHSAIMSAPPFALDASDDDDAGDDDGTGVVAGGSAVNDDGVGVPAAARLVELLPQAVVSALDSLFVSLAPTGSAVDAAGALQGAVPVQTYSSDPRAQFMASMAEMAAACGTKGMAEANYWEFMEELLLCYLERNDQAVHEYVLAAFADLTEADLTARRCPKKRRRLRRRLRRLMRRKTKTCVSPFQAHDDASLQN